MATLSFISPLCVMPNVHKPRKRRDDFEFGRATSLAIAKTVNGNPHCHRGLLSLLLLLLLLLLWGASLAQWQKRCAANLQVRFEANRNICVCGVLPRGVALLPSVPDLIRVGNKRTTPILFVMVNVESSAQIYIVIIIININIAIAPLINIINIIVKI